MQLLSPPGRLECHALVICEEGTDKINKHMKCLSAMVLTQPKSSAVQWHQSEFIVT